MDKQFKTYLENIIDLEKTAYTQSTTLQELNSRIARLGKPAYITKTEVTRYADWVGEWLASGFLCVPAGAIFFGVKGLFSDFISGAISGALKGALVGLCVALVYSIIKYFIVRAKENSTQESYDMNYNQEKRADQIRVAEEKIIQGNLIALRDKLNAQYDKTTETLNQYYNIGVLFPKYHNINAVCSIYEYFVSGRCSQLTGHEGAYNLYESEIRANLIIEKLDDIILSLERIKGNQYMLYSAINEGNRKMDRLIAESERQTQLASFNAEQSAIAAYNSAVACDELKQIKWLKTYELHKKGLYPC